MNYKGLWSATEQYYKNDVVVGVLDNALYILAGATALLGGTDPSLNAQWDVLSSAGPVDGVDSVTASTGLNNIGTAKAVILVNTGVLEVLTDPDTGIQNTGTAQNQTLINTGVLSIQTNTLTGIANTGSAQDQILVNTGVLGVTAQNGCANTGTSTAPVIENTGVLQVTAQNGCVNTGSAQNVVIEGTGVLSIAVAGSDLLPPDPAGGGGIAITGSSSSVLVGWKPLFSGVITVFPVPPPSGQFYQTIVTPYVLTADSIIILQPVGTDLPPPSVGVAFNSGVTYTLDPVSPNSFRIYYIPQFSFTCFIKYALLQV
jgi:hypothetical protein